MHCNSCGAENEFDRVVVGHATRPVFGVVCVDCVKRHLGPLVGGAAVSTDGCCLCGDEGAYALPEWDAMGVDEEDGALEFLEYSIDPTTPRLCENHYAEIEADETAAADAITSVRAAGDD